MYFNKCIERRNNLLSDLRKFWILDKSIILAMMRYFNVKYFKLLL